MPARPARIVVVQMASQLDAVPHRVPRAESRAFAFKAEPATDCGIAGLNYRSCLNVATEIVRIHLVEVRSRAMRTALMVSKQKVRIGASIVLTFAAIAIYIGTAQFRSLGIDGDALALLQGGAGLTCAAAVGFVLCWASRRSTGQDTASDIDAGVGAGRPPLPGFLARAVAVGLVTFLLVAGLGVLGLGMIERARAEARNQEIRLVAKDQARLVEQLLMRSLSANYALEAVVRQGRGEILDFERIGGELLKQFPAVSALQLAPRGIVLASVPSAGNEQAIGHNLLADMERNREAKLALETRRLTLAGPFELRQGGWAVVGRLPVFHTDPSGAEEFWGFTTTVIRVERLLEASRLEETLREGGFRFALWRTNSSDAGRLTIGRSAGADLSPASQTERIDAPNAAWFLSVEPVAGRGGRDLLLFMGAIVLLASLAAGYLGYVLVQQPWQLRLMVNQRTSELARTNVRLEGQIAERVQAEKGLLHLNRLHGLLSRINEAIVRHGDAETLLREICRIAVDENECTVAMAVREEENPGRLAALASAGVSGAGAEQRLAALDPVAGEYGNAVAIAHRDGVFFAGPEAGQGGSDAPGLRLCTLLAIPVESRGWWLLALWSTAPEPFDEARRRLMQGLVADIAYALVTIEQSRQAGLAGDRLRESEERFRTLVETSDDWVWEVDAQGRYTYASPRVLDILGFAPEEVVGRTPFDLMPPEEAARIGALFAEIVREQRSFTLLENLNLHRDGTLVMLETSGRPFFDADGRLLGYRGIDRDVTARNQANEELRKLSRAVGQSANAVMITDTRGTIEYVNPKFCELTGYAAEEVLGQNPRFLKSGEVLTESYREMWTALLAGKEWYGEFHNRKKNGELFWCLESISPLKNEKGEITHFVSIKEDISSRKLAESTIRQLAYFDTLTGLPNKRLFRDRLEQAAATAQRAGGAFALGLIDIKKLSNVNVALGHRAGDSVICATAQRISTALRPGDTLARIEGDEFAVILAELHDVGDAARVARQIVADSELPLAADGHSVFARCSVGLSLYPADTHDLDLLNRNAGAALHRARDEGDGCQFFTAEMNAETLRRVVLENALREALGGDQFFIELQPQIDLASGDVCGAEVLLRCRHPALAGVSPGSFIPIAEEIGLIAPIGEWVLRSACTTIAGWHGMRFRAVPLAVNISARQFRDPDFVERITAILRETGVPHELIELELTESAIMEDSGEAIERLRRLADTGLRIAVDDFGTGYSSLSYLKRMPIDVLKIDRSFVRDLAESSDDVAIVGSIVALARSLRLRTIAEGVETVDQLELLRRLGCDCVQGFLQGRPMPASEFRARVEAERAKRRT